MEKRVYKKGGLLHKVAFDWNTDYRKKPPMKTSSCKLFWLTVFGLFIAWPFIFITRVFGWVVRIVLALPVFIFFGYKPTGTSWRFGVVSDKYMSTFTDVFPFEPISWWPRIDGAILMPLPIFIIGYALYKAITKAIYYALVKPSLYLFGWKGSLFGLVLIIALIFAIRALRKTEFWGVAKDYYKSFSEKYCREVEFE